jgi:hypothetical protein
MKIDVILAVIAAGVGFGMFFSNPWIGVGVAGAAYAMMPYSR